MNQAEMAAFPVRVRVDGSVECDGTVVAPWPSLRMTPQRTLAFTTQLLRARHGDPLWVFTRSIPTSLLHAARSAPERNWALLEMAASAPARGAEMLQHCPALAMLVVRNYRRGRESRENYYRRLLGLAWRCILRELAIPAECRIVRLLCKVPMPHCYPATLDFLVEAIRTRHPHVRLLSHLPRITRDTVALLRLPPAKVNPQLLLASSASDQDEERIAWRVETVTWFHEQEKPGRPWPYGQLDAEALGRVEAVFRSRYLDGVDACTAFPEPPFPDLPGRITALRDYISVVKEGDEQVNCAQSFIPDIINGRCYLYSIEVGERATLALRCHEDGAWRIDDLRARRNRPPPEEAVARVHAWFAEHAALPPRERRSA